MNEILTSWQYLIISFFYFSPHFRFRFWETDIRAARKINRSTIRRKNTLNKSSWVLKDIVGKFYGTLYTATSLAARRHTTYEQLMDLRDIKDIKYAQLGKVFSLHEIYTENKIKFLC